MSWNEFQASGSVIDHLEWNTMVSSICHKGSNYRTIVMPYGISSQTISGGTIRANSMVGGVLSQYAGSSSVRSRFQASSLSYASYKHSANTTTHGLPTTNLRVASVSSQGRISGQWWSPIYNTGRPTAGVNNVGQIIRTSGSTGIKTWVWMSVRNDSNTYEWIQIGISS